MSLEAAQELRTKGAMLSRAKTEGYKGMYFGHCTTLATRLRCEVRVESYWGSNNILEI